MFVFLFLSSSLHYVLFLALYSHRISYDTLTYFAVACLLRLSCKHVSFFETATLMAGACTIPCCSSPSEWSAFIVYATQLTLCMLFIITASNLWNDSDGQVLAFVNSVLCLTLYIFFPGVPLALLCFIFCSLTWSSFVCTVKSLSP